MQDVSVVTLALNARDTIEEALHSVLTQDEVGEVIVVDDGSTDGTGDVVRAMNDPRIRIIPGPKAGFTPALNCGLRAASCDFIALCDSDDWWSADRLGWQRRWMAENPDFAAVSGGFASATPDGEHVADLAIDMAPGEVTQTLQGGMPITSFCTYLTRREVLEKIDFARDWFETSSDLDLQFRLSEVGKVWHEPVICYHYRLHEASVTHQQPAPRRVFFEEAAKSFAAQRKQGGTDDLMKGTPPVFTPSDQEADQKPTALNQQLSGHLVGGAWRAHGRGETGVALRKMGQALRRAPLSLSTWRNAGVLVVKTLIRR